MAATSVTDRSERLDPLEARIVEAMLECIGRWGIAKTTADDIARTAGISRATLYRAFPGGKDVALDALLRTETGRFFASVAGPLEQAETLEEALVIGIVGAARFLHGHAALRYLLAHEPERVLPLSTLQGAGNAYAIATAFTAPHLRPHVADDATAQAAAEWVVRQFFSYVLVPSPSLDLTDDGDVRRFVRTYLLPALAAGTVPPQEP
jgi:AcrR family transcriptional regulator